jgi:MinD-like ATPase involved in chromosome partitioning or flagellar assembly
MQFGRSCLVDLHQQAGQVAVQLKMVPPRNTWVDLVSDQGLDKRMIGSALMLDHAAGVAVLAGPLGPTRARLDARSLNYLFSVLSEGFRRIVVDAQTSLDDMTLATLMHASHLVMVVGDDPADLITVPETLRAVRDLKLPATHHIVLNHTRPSGVTHDAVMRAVNQPLSSDIPFEPAQAEALQNGMPLIMSRPDSLFSRALLQLARQL